MDDILNSQVFGMSALELFAASLGIISVGLTIVRSIWCWPIGAVMVALYVWIFWQAKLYADSGLQVVYFILQLYGWWYWLSGASKNSQKDLKVSHAPRPFLGGSLLGASILSAAFGYVLHRFTDQALPYGDAIVTVFSLLAQLFLTRKQIENWLVWIFVDVIACGIYATKGLYPTAALYAIYLIMAVLGWREWRRAMLFADLQPEAPVKVATT